MLQKLFIKNYALIDELELNLSNKLNIITGETGAGKSIILGALSMILGQRANVAALKNQGSKCVVEGTFDIKAYQLNSFFEQEELDYEEQTIIRREISTSGKSRAFINDTPVKLQTLKELTEQLVNLHAQHQTLHLYDTQYQLFIIDTLAEHTPLLEKYQALFKAYRKNQRKLKKLTDHYLQLQKDLDYITFQLNEFEEVGLQDPAEQDKLETEVKQLNNAEEIKRALSESTHAIEESEQSVVSQINVIKSALANIASFNPEVGQLHERIESVSLELQDISSELSRLEDDVMMDPKRAVEIEARLDLIYRLQNKHQVNNIAALIDIETALAEKSSSVTASDSEIQALKDLLAQQLEKLLATAKKISNNRKKQIPVFEHKINNLLTKVGMKDASIKTQQVILGEEELGLNGIDQIEVLFAANKGSSHAELKKVASGGELSRLMLCIQSLVAANTALPTLIFDEIDTGISGEVALKVGNVMQNLAVKHQLICITHLPQIASKGHSHYFVYKDNSSERTISRIKQLSEKERVTEIAKMLSGDAPGKMALANAKELLSC